MSKRPIRSMFTGSEEALTKVQALVSQFDVGSARLTGSQRKQLPPALPIFSSINLSLFRSSDLEETLHDFGENLKTSGLNDPGLFNTLQSMKFNEKTQSLVFTGDPKSLERVKQLLKEFDIPSNLAPRRAGRAPTFRRSTIPAFLSINWSFIRAMKSRTLCDKSPKI